jgi:hypothetical protein
MTTPLSDDQLHALIKNRVAVVAEALAIDIDTLYKLLPHLQAGTPFRYGLN